MTKRHNEIGPGFRKKEDKAILILFILFFAGSIFHLISFTEPYVVTITDIFLLSVNSLVFYFIWKHSGSVKFLAWSIAAFLITFLLEFAGVKTGKIFGGYHYGSTMIFQVGNVPLVIAFNWVILILGSFSVSRKLIPSGIIAPILGSLLIVGFDYLMEPVAMKLDYWQWEKGYVPLQNYLAWFIISILFSYALAILRVRPDSKILRYYFFIQLGFFLILRIEMLL